MITRLPIQQRFAKKAERQYEADIAEMNALVDGIIAERRAHPNRRQGSAQPDADRGRPGDRRGRWTISTSAIRC